MGMKFNHQFFYVCGCTIKTYVILHRNRLRSHSIWSKISKQSQPRRKTDLLHWDSNCKPKLSCLRYRYILKFGFEADFESSNLRRLHLLLSHTHQPDISGRIMTEVPHDRSPKVTKIISANTFGLLSM